MRNNENKTALVISPAVIYNRQCLTTNQKCFLSMHKWKFYNNWLC